MLTVAKLLNVLEGLDPDAHVIVGIIDGPRYNAVYAAQQVSGTTLIAYICCDHEPRPWEGPMPRFSDDGTPMLGHDLDGDVSNTNPEDNQPRKGD